MQEPIASIDLQRVTANFTLGLRTDFIGVNMSLGSLTIKDMITKESRLPNLISPALKVFVVYHCINSITLI